MSDIGRTHYYGDGCDPPHVMRDPVPMTDEEWVPFAEATGIEPLSYTCPRCGRTSHHPDDVREGYCGACHDWTRDDA